MDNFAKSLRQIQKMYGLSYSRLKRMSTLPGFPLVEGVVFPKDFDDWRREYYRNQHIASIPPPDAGRKGGESAPSCDLRAFLHLVTALQLAEALLLW